jgi:tetratricopeptide (TPR) repeat protein
MVGNRRKAIWGLKGIVFLALISFLLAEGTGICGRIDEEIRKVYSELASSPDNPALHERLGKLYFKKGNLDLAKDEILSAINISPSNWSLHYELGRIYERMGEIPRAITSYSRALSLNANLIDARIGLARCYGMMGELEKAISEYRKVLSMDPVAEGVRAELRLAYIRKGDYKTAFDLWREEEMMNSLPPQLEGTSKVPDLYDIPSITLSLESSPEDIKLMKKLAISYKLAGWHRESEAVLERVLRMAPGDKEARKALREVQMHSRYVESIRKAFEERYRMAEDVGLPPDFEGAVREIVSLGREIPEVGRIWEGIQAGGRVESALSGLASYFSKFNQCLLLRILNTDYGPVVDCVLGLYVNPGVIRRERIWGKEVRYILSVIDEPLIRGFTEYYTSGKGSIPAWTDGITVFENRADFRRIANSYWEIFSKPELSGSMTSRDPETKLILKQWMELYSKCVNESGTIQEARISFIKSFISLSMENALLHELSHIKDLTYGPPPSPESGELRAACTEIRYGSTPYSSLAHLLSWERIENEVYRKAAKRVLQMAMEAIRFNPALYGNMDSLSIPEAFDLLSPLQIREMARTIYMMDLMSQEIWRLQVSIPTNPRNWDQVLSLARIYARIGLPGKAAELLRKTIDVVGNPPDEILVAYADMLIKLGKEEEGESTLRRIGGKKAEDMLKAWRSSLSEEGER